MPRLLVLIGIALGAIPVCSCGGAGDIHDVYMALDAAGDRRRTQFYTDTLQIFCDVDYSSQRKDVTVKALVEQLDPKTGERIREIAQSEQAPGQSEQEVLSFEIVKLTPMGMPDTAGAIPWPTGLFRCSISENGNFAKSVRFTIVAPSCPEGFAERGSPCQDFYSAGYTPDPATGGAQACPDDHGKPLCCDPNPLNGWVDPQPGMSCPLLGTPGSGT